jgi:uncharacterized membrane protein YbhN (UPF0104 family)
VAALQIVALVVLLGALGYAARSAWHDAQPLLEHADRSDIALGCLFLAVYYLAFILGWMRILRVFGAALPYREALRAEMLSLLAKYIPGGVWTPAARVVACRSAGITDTTLVLSSIGFEAGLSAIAGVLVFVLSIPTVGSVSGSTTALLILFAVLVGTLLHPRVFLAVTRRIARPLGLTEDIPVLPFPVIAQLVAYYAFTWLIGGCALFFMCSAVGDPPAHAIPFMGGASAVGAIVAVLVVFAPSGLGVREASVATLLQAVVPLPVALGTVVLNRLGITLVEAALLAVTALLPRPPREHAADAAQTSTTGEVAPSASRRR